MKKSRVYILVIAVLLLAGIAILPNGKAADAGGASPWLGISSVKNMDVWRKGEDAVIKLGIAPPKGAEGVLDIKLYALANDGTETHAQDILAAQSVGQSTEYTHSLTVPTGLANGMYMLRCSYDTGIQSAPKVTANAVVVILDKGRLYGWQGDMFYDIDGAVQSGIYAIYDAETNENKYYLFENGIAVSGMHSENGYTYMFSKSSGMLTGWQQQDGWRYFSDKADSYGEMATGWLNDKGTWYLLDSKGTMQTGWQKDGDKWFYLKANGSMVTGWQRIGGGAYGPVRWYYFSANGTMQTGWVKDGGKWYYMQPSGAMATGWQQIGGKWYYLDPSSGAMQTGWVKTGGGGRVADRWFYLDPISGAMHSNTTVDGYKLGFDGAML